MNYTQKFWVLRQEIIAVIRYLFAAFVDLNKAGALCAAAAIEPALGYAVDELKKLHAIARSADGIRLGLASTP